MWCVLFFVQQEIENDFDQIQIGNLDKFKTLQCYIALKEQYIRKSFNVIHAEWIGEICKAKDILKSNLI